jgi:predicted metal-binding membrane protein
MTATPMSKARAGILVGLLALTVASWVFVLGLGDHRSHTGSPTMGLSAGLFLAMWIAMMVATMFPAIAPMVLMVARISANKRAAGHTVSPLKYFLAGYLLLWTALGVPTYFLAVGAEELAARADVVSDNAARIGGALIVLAGAYQFSKLKDRCLTACRSPLHFVMAHWRDGRGGALRMGIHHGWHCAGCCWALMLVMFPLGMMNIAALATVTALIYAEKVLPFARGIRYGAGAALIAFGLAVMIAPDLLPGSLAHSGGEHVGHTMHVGH